MKKVLNIIKQVFLYFLILIFLFCLLFYSEKCLFFASEGLLIWYQNMIPSLFPFMVLSGFMVRSGISQKIGQLLKPFLGSFFHLPSQMLYAIFMGFLCGFPMGAKIVADLLEKEQITPKEGEYLLAFCNNIGPLYMLGYVIPLFKYKNTIFILSLMYLIPLGYGLFLRYFHYRFSYSKKQELFSSEYKIPSSKKFNSYKSSYTSYNSFFPRRHKLHSSNTLTQYFGNSNTAPNYASCFQQALTISIEQITLLGGCMVFFNCLRIFPLLLGNYLTQGSFPVSHSLFLEGVLCSLLEIGGGLKQLTLSFTETEKSMAAVFIPLSLLTLGGVSCIAQTCFILKNTGLKISTYLRHKFIQSCIFLFFLFFYFL